MTFEASRLTVLAITAPQPSWKALAITFRLVPGGPDAMINGLGSLSPSTVIDRVGILLSPFSVAKRKKDSEVFPQKFQAAWNESSIIARNCSLRFTTGGWHFTVGSSHFGSQRGQSCRSMRL